MSESTNYMKRMLGLPANAAAQKTAQNDRSVAKTPCVQQVSKVISTSSLAEGAMDSLIRKGDPNLTPNSSTW